MSTYVPGTQEKDPYKILLSLQQIGPGLDAANTNIATNTTNIATNTTNIATNTTNIATIQGDYASKTSNNSLAGIQTVTNATASSSTSTGAVVVTGGVGAGGAGNFGGNVAAPSVTPNAAPGTAWGIDCRSCTIAVSGSGNSVIPDGAGLIMITDGSVTGDTGIYVTGGSAAALIGQSTGTSYVTPTTTPAANKYCIAFNGTHYAIYNGNASSITFTLAMIRTRATV